MDLAGWPAGTRAICAESGRTPAPAKMTFTNHDGHRFQVIITNQPDPDIAALEARHRAHARVEDRIRGAKATGLVKLALPPVRRQRRLADPRSCLRRELSLSDPGVMPAGELAIAEPAPLRYRLHTAGRLVRHGRRVILCLQRTWPWTLELVAAFGRLRALPARR